MADALSRYLAGVQERLHVAERERAVAEAQSDRGAAAAKSAARAGGLGAGAHHAGWSEHDVLPAAECGPSRGGSTCHRSGNDAPRSSQSRNRRRSGAGKSPWPPSSRPTQPDTRVAAGLMVLQKEIQDGLDAARRDKALLDRLVDIRSADTDDRDGLDSDASYARAFREAGIDLATLPPIEAGAKIKARPLSVATALAAALDHWAAICRGQRKDAAGAAHLSEAARVADPDPWRIDLRAALDETRQGRAADPIAGRWQRRPTTTSSVRSACGLLGRPA